MPGPNEFLEFWLRGNITPPINQHMAFHAMLGEAWRVSHYQEDVATPSGTIDLLLIPQESDKEPHVLRTIGVHADSLFWAFEDFDISATGTLAVAANFRRASQGIVLPDMIVYHTPTVTRLGPAFGPQFIPGGSTANAQGFQYVDQIPITMQPGIPALFRLQNSSGIVGDIYMELAWWEDAFEDPNLPMNGCASPSSASPSQSQSGFCVGSRPPEGFCSSSICTDIQICRAN